MRVGLVLKATRRCNLRCHYCHDWRSGPEHDMSFATVAHVTATVLQHPSVKSALFTWHGGEPTLLPLDFYRRALLAQSRLKRDDQSVGNAIQTNATRLNHEWCQFLADNRFHVGVSVDGPRSLQDLQRPFISGRGSSEQVHRGIQLLKSWGIEPGVLMVIDRAAIELGPRAMFDFILSLGIKWIGLNSARPTNDPAFLERPKSLRQLPSHYTTQSETTAFLLGLYDECEKNADAKIEIRELEALRRRITGDEARLCTLAGACIGQHFLVEPNGDFAHCDLFVGDPAYTIGNVYKEDFGTILQSEALARLRRFEERSQQSMSSCPYYKICNGGCPHDRYLAIRYDPKYSDGCCGQHDLISALTERMHRRERRPRVSTSIGSPLLQIKGAQRRYDETRGPAMLLRAPSVYVKDTGTIKGRGVFALRGFEGGEVIETCPVVLMRLAFDDLPKELRERVFDWEVLAGAPPNTHALAHGHGSLYNNANPANMRYEAFGPGNLLRFIAVRDIGPDEELTINYNARGGGAEWHDTNWFDRMNIKPI